MASIVRSGSTVFHLSSSAPPRLCASQGTLWRFNPTREGRPPRRPKAPAVGSTVPLTVLSQVSAPSASMPAPAATFRSALSSLRFQPRQTSSLLNLIFHFVHFFLNKAAGCAIHTALVLRHSPDGALLNSSRSGNYFVAFSRLTNGGSVPSDWILFSNGRDDLCILPRGRDDLRVVRLSALTLISSAAPCNPWLGAKGSTRSGPQENHRVFHAVVVAAFVLVEATLLSLE